MMSYPLESSFLYATAMAFGMVVGSFLNVVIHRLPQAESIAFPGSHCPSCKTPIAAFDNVPVLSYLWLRGRCRHCQIRISLRYPAIELLTGCIFALVVWRFGPSWLSLVYVVFASGLIAAAAIDIDYQIIPDEISLGGLVLGFLAVPTVYWVGGMPYAQALLDSGLGALVGAGALWIVAFLHARVSVATGREFSHWPGEGESLPTPSEADYWLWFPGLGLGDVKLLAMIGAFVGPLGVLDTIVSASLIGLVMGVAWAAVTRSWNSPFGFAPAIALGALLALLFPNNLVQLFQ